MIQFFCLNVINRPPRKSLNDVLDGYHRNLGCPEATVRQKVFERISKLDEVLNWVEFFRMIEVEASQERIYEILTKEYSKAKNECSNGVDSAGFSKVQSRRSRTSVKRVAERFEDL